jgi:hypothetical protein
MGFGSFISDAVKKVVRAPVNLTKSTAKVAKKAVRLNVDVAKKATEAGVKVAVLPYQAQLKYAKRHPKATAALAATAAIIGTGGGALVASGAAQQVGGFVATTAIKNKLAKDAASNMATGATYNETISAANAGNEPAPASNSNAALIVGGLGLVATVLLMG